MNTIHINGKSYASAEMTFNNVCRMEEMDAPITMGAKVSFSMIRAYLALCMNTTKEKAGEELELHVVNGGDFDELAEAMSQAIEDSDFFRKLSEEAAETTQPLESKTKKKD